VISFRAPRSKDETRAACTVCGKRYGLTGEDKHRGIRLIVTAKYTMGTFRLNTGSGKFLDRPDTREFQQTYCDTCATSTALKILDLKDLCP
jgi:hypothetical protein